MTKKDTKQTSKVEIDITQGDGSSAKVGDIYVEGHITAEGDVTKTTIHGDQNIYQGFSAEQVEALIVTLRKENQPQVWDGRIPYLGLAAFQESDAEFFFGRETLIDDLLERVETSNFIAISGPSGSGKSSLARAGLFHALRSGRLPKSDKWLLATMQPEGDPLEQLARAMARVTKSAESGREIRRDPEALWEQVDIHLSDDKADRLVLLVDQFEEVFTQTKDAQIRATFIDLLVKAAETTDHRITVILSLRSDFISNCITYPQLREKMNHQLQLVGAMTSEDLTKAITLPSLEVGSEIDPALVSRIVDDMKGEPGTLPLMSFALRDLFEAEKTTVGEPMDMTLPEYIERGGVERALERHAQQVFADFGPEQEALAKNIFTKLIEVGQGRVDTRRTASLEELIPAGATEDETLSVLSILTHESVRLITTSGRLGEANNNQSTVTIAHEKLIDAWPWLRQLVDENRELIALQNQISADAQAWQVDEDGGFLYREGRLAQVEERLDELDGQLDALSHRFIDESIQQQKKRRQRDVRQRNLALFLAGIAVVFAFVSLYSSNQTTKALEKSEAAVRTSEAAVIAMVTKDARLDAQAVQLALLNEVFSEATREVQTTSVATSISDHTPAVIPTPNSPIVVVTLVADNSPTIESDPTRVNDQDDESAGNIDSGDDPEGVVTVEPSLSVSDIADDAYSNSWRSVIWDISNILETGSLDSDPAAYQNIDSGIVSYGAHQVTLSSGNLGRVLELYFANSDSETREALENEYFARVQAIDPNLRDDTRFRDLLIEAAAEPEMIQAQNDIFAESFYNPSVEKALEIGIQSPLGVAVFYDTRIQHGGGGLEFLIDVTDDSLGGAIGDNDITEEQWLATFLDEREDLLNRLAERSDDNGDTASGDFLRASTFRPQELRALLESGNSALAGVFTVQGQQIVSGLAHPLAIACPDMPDMEFQIYFHPADSRQIIQPFGANPEVYAQFGAPGHTGIDFGGVEEVTNIFSVADGVVIAVRRQSNGFGNHVYIRHGDDENLYTTIYAHMFSINVSQGQEVEAGALLGKLGNTGVASDPHLHFELRGPEGDPGWPRNIIDPTPFLFPCLGFVELEGPYQEGWVVDWAITLVGDVGQVNTMASLRSGPGSNSPRIDILPLGTMLLVDGEHQGGYIPVLVPLISLE